jgi:hypothetical protein
MSVIFYKIVKIAIRKAGVKATGERLPVSGVNE